MGKLIYNFGRKVGSAINKGKWYYQSTFGSEGDALKAELAVGRELARQISQQTKIINDAAKQIILDDVGHRLQQRLVNKKRGFKFYLIASKDINAFALPGGLIFITDLLFKRIADKRDEIAFVLAHEMMHIVFRHPMEKIFADYSTKVISRLLVKGGTLGLLAKQMLVNLLNSSYSQDKELEADEYAVRLSYRAGFNPRGAEALLSKLKNGSTENLAVFHYFLSHPPIEQRIAHIDSIMKAHDMKLKFEPISLGNEASS